MEIRNYSPDMIYNYCKFYNKARSDRPDFEEVTVEAIHAYFTPPYYDPKGHFLALIDDQIIADVLGSRNLGYMVFPEETESTLLSMSCPTIEAGGSAVTYLIQPSTTFSTST